MSRVTFALFSLMAPMTVGAQVLSSEFEERRQSVMSGSPDRLVLLTSNWDVKPDGQDGFRQTPSFYYLTGLENQIGAILLLDGPLRESTLFVPDDDPGVQLFNATVRSGDSTAQAMNLTRVLSISEFEPFFDSRNAEAQGLTVLVERQGPRAPPVPGLGNFADRGLALRDALAARWPDLQLEALEGEIRLLRMIKSALEIEAIREAGRAASQALLAGLTALEPGKAQREVEVEMAAACFRAGADGVSWWPWAQTGPNAVFPFTFTSFADYRHLDREMGDGELARLDVGCQYDHYQSDVGRTAPVSGRWTAAQRETWDLLITAYRTGLSAIRDGVSVDLVRSAFEEGVRLQEPELQTELAREAAAIMLDRTRSPSWQIHGVGLEHGERVRQVLSQGMVIAFEPMFTVRSLGFYLEDLLLITEDGYELLTPDLPYTAQEIEEAMRRR